MYSAEEIRDSVNKFLLDSVSTPRTSTGTREVLVAREDIYALLTTSLLLRPDSFFYVIWLAKNKLEALRQAQYAAVDALVSTTNQDALKIPPKPVQSTTDLVNAQAALLNMNAGLNSGTGTKTKELGPEVARFRNSIDKFINTEIKKNVVSGGDVVPTADQVRTDFVEKWAEIKERDAEIKRLCVNIAGALDALVNAKLPQAAIQGVVTRLRERLEELIQQYEESLSTATYRFDLLDLLTMRTVLSRVSGFRAPTKVLAPLSGDSASITAISGTTPASLLGTTSGPFNIQLASTLDLEVGTPATPLSVPLGVYSNATMLSKEGPFVFPAGAVLELRVNGTVYPDSGTIFDNITMTASDFRDALALYISTNSIPAIASLSGNRVRLYSTSPDDDSELEISVTTNDQAAFLGVSGFSARAVVAPVTMAKISEIFAAYPSVTVAERYTFLGRYEGTTAAGGLVTTNAPTGLVGARAYVVDTNSNYNTGWYRLLGTNMFGELIFDRDFVDIGNKVTVMVSRSYLEISAVGTSPVDTINAWPPSPGALATGLMQSATPTYPGITHLETPQTADFVARGVSPGDRVVLGTPTPVTTTITVPGVSELDVDPVAYFSGAVSYSVQSARYLAWEALVDVTETYLQDVDFEAADFAASRVMGGAAMSSEILGAFSAYRTELADLEDIQQYVVPFERTIDDALRMLAENGYDRAADLFTSLEISEFFEMHPDGASYSTNLMRVAADVTRQVAPVSRMAQGPLNLPDVEILSRRLTTQR